MELILETQGLLPSLKGRHLIAELIKEGNSLFTLTYDVPLRTARLESSNGTKRVFMLYHEGKRLPRIVFKNEYGFDVGNIDMHNLYDNRRRISIYEKEFYYNDDFLQTDKIIIYQDQFSEALLQVDINHAMIAKYTDKEDYFFGIIVGICWFMSLPAAMSPAAEVMKGFTTTHSQQRVHA